MPSVTWLHDRRDPGGYVDDVLSAPVDENGEPLPDAAGAAQLDYLNSLEWSAWLDEAYAHDPSVTLYVDNRKKKRFVVRTRDGKTDATYYVPGDLWFEGTESRTVWRQLEYELWVRLAERLGWPEPPPPPAPREGPQDT